MIDYIELFQLKTVEIHPMFDESNNDRLDQLLLIYNMNEDDLNHQNFVLIMVNLESKYEIISFNRNKKNNQIYITIA
jgi:hypothetical protein